MFQKLGIRETATNKCYSEIEKLQFGIYFTNFAFCSSDIYSLVLFNHLQGLAFEIGPKRCKRRAHQFDEKDNCLKLAPDCRLCSHSLLNSRLSKAPNRSPKPEEIWTTPEDFLQMNRISSLLFDSHFFRLPPMSYCARKPGVEEVWNRMEPIILRAIEGIKEGI
jgi:hypothetical protein